jgi:RimJ/RimL family protein N-acetyltransferase
MLAGMPSCYFWGVYDATNTLIGIVEIIESLTKPNEATVGYMIAKDNTGAGIATKALKEVIAKTEGVTRFTGHVLGENPKSIRVLLNAGFVRSGSGITEEYVLTREKPALPTRN